MTVEKYIPAMGGFTVEQVRNMLRAQRESLTSAHETMPLALVLQYCPKDAVAALDLAKLLADIEDTRRTDVLFVFAEQAGTKEALGVEEYKKLHLAKDHVAEKFPAFELRVEVDPRKKYPAVCYDQWAGSAAQLCDLYHDGEIHTHSAFFFEADGAPTRKTWIDDLKRAHAETLAASKLVTGPRMAYPPPAGDRLHVNGTMIMHLRMWLDYPSLHRCPPNQQRGEGWDIFHGHAFISELDPAQIIGNLYGFPDMSEGAWQNLSYIFAWLTSIKDSMHQKWARKNLVSST